VQPEVARKWHLDVGYDRIDQHVLRQGSKRADPQAVADSGQEVEQRTLTQTQMATLRYDAGSVQWGLQLPYRERQHSALEDGEQVALHTRALGDARLWASKAIAPEMNLQMGVKLPTGAHDATNSNGERADRGLQPGSGTTDLFAAFQWTGMRGGAWATSAYAQGQVSLNSREGYRPGSSLRTALVLDRNLSESVALQVQGAIAYTGRDKGWDADAANSGGTRVLLASRLCWHATSTVDVYASAQATAWSHVNGVQLEAPVSFSVGTGWRF
jgi:hypothetical protein